MPEGRLQRTREGSREINCSHLLLFVHGDSDRAPFILENGDRKTIKSCYYCGKKFEFIRTNEEFKKELKQYFKVK